MKQAWLLIPLVLFGVLAAFLYRGLSLDPAAMPSAMVGKQLPSVQWRTLDDQPIKASQFLGQPALINVWATWCPTCKAEHGYLNTLSEAGVRIIGLNYKDDPKLAQQWLERYGDPYAVNLLDLSGRVGIELGVYGAPETYLIDAQGNILAKHVGVVNEDVWQNKFAEQYFMGE